MLLRLGAIVVPLIAIIIGIFMVVIDSTVINVALQQLLTNLYTIYSHLSIGGFRRGSHAHRSAATFSRYRVAPPGQGLASRQRMVPVVGHTALSGDHASS